jgi:uncharacterized SAM-binding protein YcdF (DUF218 family)
MELPATAIREGNFERVDLTLLSLDEQKLPIYLQMRRMSLCDNKPWPGESVIVAIPEGTARSHIMLPSLLPAEYQKRFSTVISDVATTGNSGSGVFDAGQKCLLGIVSLKIYQTPSSGALRWLVVVSLIGLVTLGLSPVGNILMIPLETRFPPWDAARGAPDGIIVLGGVIESSGRDNQIMLNEGAERLAVVPDLARRYPNARILFSGGSAALIGDGSAEASPAARLLESFGISRDRLLLEDRSRNTVENAVYSKLIVHPKRGERWLLVTSAFHMPRAIGVFRKVGFPVEPYPVDWRTRGAEDMMRPFAVMSDGLQRSDTAVHEWVGLLVYWLTKRSSELFPGPTQDAL